MTVAPVAAAATEATGAAAAGETADTRTAGSKAADTATPAVAGAAASPRRQSSGRSFGLPARVSSAAETGAGVVLAVLFWGWVALPFLRGRMPEVKAVWRAKWLNQAPDGTWLP